MKSFSIFMGKLPFAGKHAIRSCFSLLLKSRTFSERFRNYLVLLAVFALMFWGHGSQVHLGMKLVLMENAHA